MVFVNEWLCSYCRMVYATSKEMALQEAKNWYIGELEEGWDWVCIGCDHASTLVARYTDDELALLNGQLSLWVE